jgi:hypothetical protein
MIRLVAPMALIFMHLTTPLALTRSRILYTFASGARSRFSAAVQTGSKLHLDGKGFAKGSRDEKARYKLENEQLSGIPDISKPYLVLGIESSCDDTGIAIVNSNGKVYTLTLLLMFHDNNLCILSRC